jgi:hypothetical protein
MEPRVTCPHCSARPDPQSALPISLQLDRRLSDNQRQAIRSIIVGLPNVLGAPIAVSTQPHLTASGSKLLSGAHRGTPVHAASFIRERKIVLETELFEQSRLLRLILIHEIFHFVWARIGNLPRCSFAALLANETALGARGELGESSEMWKNRLSGKARIWREYVCESFCDTAAWRYAGIATHASFTLAQRWCKRRGRWFSEQIDNRCVNC